MTAALRFTKSNYFLYVTSPKRMFLCEKYYIMNIIICRDCKNVGSLPVMMHCNYSLLCFISEHPKLCINLRTSSVRSQGLINIQSTKTHWITSLTTFICSRFAYVHPHRRFPKMYQCETSATLQGRISASFRADSQMADRLMALSQIPICST